MKRPLVFQLFARPVIKTHGLLRVGTNYMQALLKNSFYVVCLGSSEGGWKHGHCEYQPTKKYIFLVKNPYAWVVSFRNWESIHNRSTAKSLAEFLTQPLSHPQLKQEWDVHSPIEAWNQTLISWLSYYGKNNTIFIRYEDLINEFEAQLSLIQDKFELRMRKKAFVNIHSRADTWETPNPRKPFQIAYYKEEKYLEEFDSQTLDILRDQLDRNLLSKFNYALF